ncbi:MAG: hypothetical protein Q8934_05475 [Bacillota bacterium]|nr:hypothetical protein [Bacillota bacterium]
MKRITLHSILGFFKRLFRKILFALGVLIVAGIMLGIIEGLETYGTSAPSHIPTTLNQIKHIHITFHLFNHPSNPPEPELKKLN